MSKKLYEESNISAIADAIRAKNGSQDTYTTAEMADAIDDIPSGGILIQKNIIDNGTYNALLDDNADGYSEVIVNVPSGGGSVTEVYTKPSSSDVPEGNVFIRLGKELDIEVKPECETFVSGIAGQHQSDARAALSKAGTNPGYNYYWTTVDRNYNDLWIGADFGEAKVLNTLVVAPRTWDNHRQIYTVIFEASNDATNWTLLGKADKKGNELGPSSWFRYKVENETAYRYYRLRTETDSLGTINRSVTFTLYGLGFLYLQDSDDLPDKAYYKKNGILYEI